MNTFRILLAEDNPADIYLIRQALRDHDVPCNIHIVEDGLSALQFIGRMEADTPQAGQPDLILLDLNLPQHDGIEILKMIRSSPRLAHVPVAILTSSDSPRDRHAVDELGVTRYIRKPSELEAFMDIGKVIKELLMDIAPAPLVRHATHVDENCKKFENTTEE